MRFLPTRPYRCLHCYHRFWQWENFFANSKRVWTWGIVLVLLTATVLSRLGSSPPDHVEPRESYGANQASQAIGSDPPESLFAESSGGTSQAVTSAKSAINSNTVSAPLTAAPSQQQLEQARAEAQYAKSLNEAKRAQLEQTMINERAELESLLKVDIGYRLENWRRAWEAGDIERYLSFYAQEFVPAKLLSRDQWEQLRRTRVAPNKSIAVQLSNFRVAFGQDYTQATVQFDQSYRSGNYQEQSRKQLTLLKQQQEWKIMAETELNN